MVKTNLIDTVVKQGLCTGCGACVSECSSASLSMDWNDYGFLTPKRNIETVDNDDLIRVCPFNPNPEEEVKDEDALADIFLKDASHYDEKVGRFENTYIGYSREFRVTSSSGGIATYIFEQLLKQKKVDRLYVVKEINGTYEYQLFDDFEQIKQISKTKYIPVTLESLFKEINNIHGKIAVSGVACFIKAVRLKQHYHPELKDKIPFLIGIICGGLKSRFFTDYLAQRAGVEGEYNRQDYRIKDAESLSSDYSFGVFDSNSNFRQMKMRNVGDMWGTGLFKSSACDFCTDVLTELADISLGDAWLEEYKKDGLGNSVVITRSKLASDLIIEGINNGELALSIVAAEKVIKSQSASFSHRQDAVKLRMLVRRIQGKIVPYVRKRVMKSISLPYKVVQLQRLQTRRVSLDIWKREKTAKTFDMKMRMHLELLIFCTKVYHKLRR